jgi:glutaryl-CoA dehydrogenase
MTTTCRREGSSVGCQMGAYEHALRYATERKQFGKPIGGFQLVQDLLVRMLGNVTSTQAMMLRLAQLQDEGVMQDEHASPAKAFCTVKCGETVGYARELLGGNGILLENHVGRFVVDEEAIYSYEGTREMNTLIVGKSRTECLRLTQTQGRQRCQNPGDPFSGINSGNARAHVWPVT